MATVASGLNSGSGFSNSDTVTSTTLNNHVNDATVTNIVNADVASNAALAVTKLADITNNNLVGRVDNANNANVPIVIGGSGDAGVLFDNDDMLDNSDTAGGSATRGATQQSIKAYIDSQINNKILGIGQFYTTVTRALDNATEYTNDTGRPILLRHLFFYTNVSGNDDISVDIAFKIGSDPFFYMRLCDCVGFSGYASDVASIIIPDGVVYKFRNNNGDNVPGSVAIELR